MIVLKTALSLHRKNIIFDSIAKNQFDFSILGSVHGRRMPEEEYTEVPVKFIEDLSHKIEQLQHSLRRKQRILNKVSFYREYVFQNQPTTCFSKMFLPGDCTTAESDPASAEASFEFWRNSICGFDQQQRAF